ncbi:MAG: hypothetical protein AAFV51_02165 [Pseudomonadota bacterium]
MGETAADIDRPDDQEPDYMPPPGGARVLTAIAGFGAIAAYAFYQIVDKSEDAAEPLFAAAATFAITVAIGWAVLARASRVVAAGVASVVIAAALAAGMARIYAVAESAPDIDTALPLFWLAAGGPLAFFLLLVFSKASIDARTPPPYRALFLHGLSLPLIGGAAKIFAGLICAFLFTWAWLFDSLGVSIFLEIVREPWFLLPFLGGVGALSVGVIRGRTAVIGALRFIVLLFCRIAAPLGAAFAITLAGLLAVQGVDGVFEGGGVASTMLAFAIAGMLIVNGVYQNGDGPPPALWLRLSTLVLLILIPLFVGLAAWALWLRVEQYGLTPPRFLGLAMVAQAVIYAAFGLIAAGSELHWRAERWMRPLGVLNTAHAGLWVVILFGLLTPLLDPYAWSARHQAERVRSQSVSIEEFDFGYLYFRLGRAGEREAEALAAINDHPEYWEINRRLEIARDAFNIYAYEEQLNPPEEPEGEADAPEAGAAEEAPGSPPPAEPTTDAATEPPAATPDETSDDDMAFPDLSDEPEPDDG